MAIAPRNVALATEMSPNKSELYCSNMVCAGGDVRVERFVLVALRLFKRKTRKQRNQKPQVVALRCWGESAVAESKGDGHGSTQRRGALLYAGIEGEEQIMVLHGWRFRRYVPTPFVCVALLFNVVATLSVYRGGGGAYEQLLVVNNDTAIDDASTTRADHRLSRRSRPRHTLPNVTSRVIASSTKSTVAPPTLVPRLLALTLRHTDLPLFILAHLC
ncbi:hypothetical protein FGB62_17g446 [Gracilaria domingensis]|nr:hypothetical protein FGB62_17g446 [Gracilaria domingensis]